MQRRDALRTGCVHTSAMLDEQAHHIYVVKRGQGEIEGCEATVAVLCVHIRTVLNQEGCSVELVVLGCRVQRCSAHLVSAGHDRGICGRQLLQLGYVALAGSIMHGISNGRRTSGAEQQYKHREGDQRQSKYE